MIQLHNLQYFEEFNYQARYEYSEWDNSTKSKVFWAMYSIRPVFEPLRCEGVDSIGRIFQLSD